MHKVLTHGQLLELQEEDGWGKFKIYLLKKRKRKRKEKGCKTVFGNVE